MLMWICVAMTFAFSTCAAALAQLGPDTIEPYPLPTAVQGSVNELAAQSDVLILGEIHGTQEVPAVAAALLAPLTKLGYQVLALEVPADQQASLTAWATGKMTAVPSFFAMPSDDGRGSIEALKLIHTALSPPFRWKLICFDLTEEDMQRQIAEMNRDAGLGAPGATTPKLESERMIALSLRHDSVMASIFADQLRHVPSEAKVLAICGNLHARTANRTKLEILGIALWPSFAAVLQSNQSARRVRSVNIDLHGGGFFNDGKVNVVHGRHLDHAESRLTPEGDWDLELGLPHATPATFAATPSNAATPAASAEPVARSCATDPAERPSQCYRRSRVRRCRRTCRN